MTDQEKRIAIATVCKTLGRWYCGTCRQEVHPDKVLFNEHNKLDTRCPACGVPIQQDSPNYLEDLNAIQDIFKLDENYFPVSAACPNLSSYVRNLSKIFNIDLDDGCVDIGDAYLICNATARQRADAFLMTIGKMKV